MDGLSLEALSSIAHKVSRRVYPVHIRDDVYQEIWLKFLRWPPPSEQYAWKAAFSARNSVWRKEKQWTRLKDEGAEALHAQLVEKQQVRRTSMPEEERRRRQRVSSRRWYHNNLAYARYQVRERVRRHRASPNKDQSSP